MSNTKIVEKREISNKTSGKAVLIRPHVIISPLHFTPTTKNPLAPGVFDAHLTAMASHYLTLPHSSFALPNSLSVINGIKLVKVPKLSFIPLINQHQNRATNWIEETKKSITVVIRNLEENKNMASFDEEINRLEAEAQDKAKQEIHHAFESIREEAHKNPAMAPQLLQKAQKIGSFWSNLVNSFKSFVAGIINKIREWVAAAIEWIENAVKDAVEWAEKAVSDVVDFFDDLF